MTVENAAVNHPQTTAAQSGAAAAAAVPAPVPAGVRRYPRWLIALGLVAWVALSFWAVRTGMHLQEWRAARTLQRFFDALLTGDYDTAAALTGPEGFLPTKDLVAWGIQLQPYTIQVRDTEMTEDNAAVKVTVDFTDQAGSTHWGYYLVICTPGRWSIRGYDPEEP